MEVVRNFINKSKLMARWISSSLMKAPVICSRSASIDTFRGFWAICVVMSHLLAWSRFP